MNKSVGSNAKERYTLTGMARYDKWPTPSVCGNYNRVGASKTSGDGLATAVSKKRFATPCATDFKGAPSDEVLVRRMRESTRGVRLVEELARDNIGNDAPRALNPDWVEWLMGWPIGATDIINECVGYTYEIHKEPMIIRTLSNVKNRTNRLRSIGNGQVPQCAATAFRVLSGAVGK